MASTKVLVDQIDRLKVRFGARAFDVETVKIIHSVVRDMSDEALIQSVTVMISSRKHTLPPLIQDFRDAATNERNQKFKGDVAGAARVMAAERSPANLKDFLVKRFGAGCKTLVDAIQIRRLQIELKRADDPSYDPAKDPEWI